jgi:ATP-binding cassette subfamily E protein 1
MQPKKSFASINYQICAPKACSPAHGTCAAVAACTHKVIKQIDGFFEQPMVFQDMCMGCWDCIAACPSGAVKAKHVT